MKKQKQLKIIMTKGLPASGKSTWAKLKVSESNGQIKRINKDDIRAMVDDSKWSKEREKYTVAARDALVNTAIKMGKSVIVDDTNLVAKHEQSLKAIASRYPNVDVEVVDHFLDIPVEECIKRDAARTGKKRVGKDIIIRMANMAGLKTSHLPCSNRAPSIDARRKTLAYDTNLPDCIICDLDGTLSLMWGNRSAYEAEKCGGDLLNDPVARIVKDYHAMGHTVILFSGRSDAGKTQTENWLHVHGIPYDELRMRKDRDFRKDSIVKEEMYDAVIKDKYNTLFVLDDRNMMVDKWREMGLLCLQVYYGDF
jgi:predicted kinase